MYIKKNKKQKQNKKRTMASIRSEIGILFCRCWKSYLLHLQLRFLDMLFMCFLYDAISYFDIL